MVTVSIARDPALVRTVRLVAAAVARRDGHDEDFVEEVRLAVGEACALLVGERDQRLDPPAEPITVAMTIVDRLTVEVVSTSPIAVDDPPLGDLKGDIDGDIDRDIEGVEPWALLRALIDDFAIAHEGDRTTVTMSWPLR